MQDKLPAPYADPETYQSMIERGLKRFPKRGENFVKCQQKNREPDAECLPVQMDFEVVSRCNFRCVMCMVSEWPGGKRADDMPYEGFEQILDELYGLVEIKLQGLGEPLLHPRIFDMISLADERDIWTRLTVNGSLLHIKENYKRLVDCNPGEIQISIDGADKEVFETIRRGANFEQVVKNTTKLNEYEQHRGVLKTRSWTVVQRTNLHQLRDIIRLGAKMKFRRMTFSVAISYFGTEKWTQKNMQIDVGCEFSRDMAEYLIEMGREYGIEVTFWDAGSKYNLNGRIQERCSWLWERAFISSDLRIVPCCVFSNPDIIDFGNAKQFTQIWNGKAYRKLRNAHLTGHIPNFCKQCYGLKIDYSGKDSYEMSSL